MYATTDKKSFISIKNLLRRAQPLRRDIVMMLVGNKNDDSERREVSREEGHSLADECGIGFSEISAKDTESVEDLFMSVLMKLGAHQYEPATVHQRRCEHQVSLRSPTFQPSISNTSGRLPQEKKDLEIGGSRDREISWLWAWWHGISLWVCGIRRP
jgi:GTPase SAR1 family protein